MNDQTDAVQQIAQRITSANNILITVSRDPSVDQLTAALGLTLIVNKLEKHATAVFSGNLPAAIDFLKPGKTFERNVDSLRDFIIELDKSKADRLRYKVEDDVVRIFITPYRTTITDRDLNFTQGDFNIDLIIAIGVETKNDLDAAIAAHGRILHDATTVTINRSGVESNLGIADWHNPNSSSFCEMIVELTDNLDSKDELFDEQNATALLTGLVSATDRFSNQLTSSQVMSMAADLMAAGANQQLIAARLQESASPSVEKLKQDDSRRQQASTQSNQQQKQKNPQKSNDGSLTISHNNSGDQSGRGKNSSKSNNMPRPNSGRNRQLGENPPSVNNDVAAAEEALDMAVSRMNPNNSASKPTLDQVQADVARVYSEGDNQRPVARAIASPEPAPSFVTDYEEQSRYDLPPVQQPSFGGTLNAIGQEAAEQKRREATGTQNRTMLSHDAPPAAAPGDLEFAGDSVQDLPPPVSPIGKTIQPVVQPDSASNAAEDTQIDNAISAIDPSIDEARNAVANAFAAAGAAPVQLPEPVVQQSSPGYQASTPAPLPNVSVPPNSIPPLPDFSTLPPLPDQNLAPNQDFSQNAVLEQPTNPAPNDPAQFRLPGQ